MRTKDPKTFNAIYRYVESYYTEHECSPTVFNIAKAVNISPSTAHKYLKALVENGRLDQIDTRGYKPINSKYIISTEIPKVGYVSCGLPMTAEENIERYVQIPNWAFKTNQNYFCLQANGDSMIGAGIHDGDLVLVRQQENAEEGQIIVALTEEGETTLKRLKFDRLGGKIILHPENPNYQDIYCDYIKIQGVAEKVLTELD